MLKIETCEKSAARLIDYDGIYQLEIKTSFKWGALTYNTMRNGNQNTITIYICRPPFDEATITIRHDEKDDIFSRSDIHTTQEKEWHVLTIVPFSMLENGKVIA